MENGSGRPSGTEPALELAEPTAIAPAVAYVRAIRAHRRVVAGIILACILGSLAWLAVRSLDYSATAELLVSPVPEADTSFVGVPLIRDVAADPARPVETAAAIVDSPAVSRRAAERLHGDKDAGLGGGVEVEALQSQNVIAITATAATPEAAARIANAFANGAIDLRRERLQPLIADAIDKTEQQLRTVQPGSEDEGLLQARLADLETIRDGTDPTISFAQRAARPGEPNQTSKWTILMLALGAGIAIAAATAVLMELLVPGPIKDEDELRRAMPLPILARVPLLRRPTLAAPLSEAAPELTEPYRTLRGQLDINVNGRAGSLVARTQRPRQVTAVISPSAGDGRTTTALALAEAITAVGSTALILDADIRAPGVAPLLGIEPSRDLASLMVAGAPVEDAVTRVPGAPNLSLIAAPHADNLYMVERMGAMAPEIIRGAREIADRVIIDTPPLGEVSDALSFLAAADQVVVVARIGHTTRSALENLREVLERSGVRPIGYVVLNASSAGSSVSAILERASIATGSRVRPGS